MKNKLFSNHHSQIFDVLTKADKIYNYQSKEVFL